MRLIVKLFKYSNKATVFEPLNLAKQWLSEFKKWGYSFDNDFNNTCSSDK